MKRMLFRIVVALIVCFCLPAKAGEDNFYTRFDLAYTDGTDKNSDCGYAVKAGFGTHRTNWLRTELSVEKHANDLSGEERFGTTAGGVHGRLSALSVFTSAAFDIFSIRGVTPYVTGGIGVSRNKMTEYSVGNVSLRGDRKIKVAWKAGAGIGFALPKDLTLDIGYVYTDLGRFGTRPTHVAAGTYPAYAKEIAVRELSVSLRYDF